MVKGISRQVIVVQSPDPKLFEQAIFILRDQGERVTDEALLKEADRLMQAGRTEPLRIPGPLWAGAGALLTALCWILSSFI